MGNQELQKKAKKFEKMNDRMLQFTEIFKPFTINDWCYESKRIFKVLELMNDNEKTVFNANPKTIDWKIVTQLNLYVCYFNYFSLTFREFKSIS